MAVIVAVLVILASVVVIFVSMHVKGKLIILSSMSSFLVWESTLSGPSPTLILLWVTPDNCTCRGETSWIGKSLNSIVKQA